MEYRFIKKHLENNIGDSFTGTPERTKYLLLIKVIEQVKEKVEHKEKKEKVEFTGKKEKKEK